MNYGVLMTHKNRTYLVRAMLVHSHPTQETYEREAKAVHRGACVPQDLATTCIHVVYEALSQYLCLWTEAKYPSEYCQEVLTAIFPGTTNTIQRSLTQFPGTTRIIQRNKSQEPTQSDVENQANRLIHT